LEKIEHRRVVEMPEHVTIRRVDVERDFGELGHGVPRLRESNVNQNRTGAPRTVSASAQAFALYVASSGSPDQSLNCSDARRPNAVSRPYAPPNVSCAISNRSPSHRGTRSPDSRSMNRAVSSINVSTRRRLATIRGTTRAPITVVS